MTDYGQFFTEEFLEEQKQRYIQKKHKESDKQLADNRTKSCNTTVGRMGLFLKHCKFLSNTMKAASDDGFCLDELIQGVKELEKIK